MKLHWQLDLKVSQQIFSPTTVFNLLKSFNSVLRKSKTISIGLIKYLPFKYEGNSQLVTE